MRVRQQLPLLFALLYGSASPWLLLSAHAGPPGRINDAQLREAIAQAVKIVHPDEAVKIRPRADLDADLSQIAGKASRNVSFYETQAAPAAATTVNDSDAPVWAAVSSGSLQESYKLYRFDSSDGPEQSSQEFNRLISQLGLSLDDDKAAGLARFFLGCCNRGTRGVIVPDEDLLHHTVQRDYLQAYGDVWRTLEAFTDWWEGYLQSAFQFPTAVKLGGGAYRIPVEIVVANFGMHPQLQQWTFELSPDGKVRVASVEAIYPKESRWLSFDFPSRIGPSIR
jgi:hypothetical protein